MTSSVFEYIFEKAMLAVSVLLESETVLFSNLSFTCRKLYKSIKSLIDITGGK